PSDYNGIVGGAPAIYNMQIHVARIGINAMANRTPDSNVPQAKYQMVHDAVLNACDALDGVKDGVLENPSVCKFDPKVLECKGPDGPTCLTAPQVETARKVYSPATNPRTKQQIFPGLLPGSELGWAIQAGPQVPSIANDFFRYVVFKD